MTTVLVADGDSRARHRTASALRLGGYTVESARTMREAGSLLRRRRLEALVVDPPGDEPREVIAEIRARTDAPILVVSDRGDESEKVAVLDAGADDYLIKPFGVEELLARVRALLRRTIRRPETATICTPHFSINLADRRFALADGTDVRLTPTEWKIVEVLVQRAGHLVSHTDLLQTVWGPKALQRYDYIRVFMAGIRRKVEPDPARPRYFITAPGLGLRFDPHGDGQR